MGKTRRLAGLVTSLVALAVSACTPKPEQPALADLQAARRASILFDARLRTDILDRLERDEDPVAVYMAYRDHAHEMTAEASQKAGIDIKRVASRVRNRDDVADDWERKKLDEFQFWLETGRDPATLETAEIVTVGKAKYFRWMRPITMGEPCLVCHGETIDPKILAMLKQDYAEDEATGYFQDELGGAYSVTKRLK